MIPCFLFCNGMKSSLWFRQVLSMVSAINRTEFLHTITVECTVSHDNVEYVQWLICIACWPVREKNNHKPKNQPSWRSSLQAYELTFPKLVVHVYGTRSPVSSLYQIRITEVLQIKYHTGHVMILSKNATGSSVNTPKSQHQAGPDTKDHTLCSQLIQAAVYQTHWKTEGTPPASKLLTHELFENLFLLSSQN